MELAECDGCSPTPQCVVKASLSQMATGAIPGQQGTPVPQSSGLGSECVQGPWDPKGGELYRSTTKPWETVVEVGRCSDVQIV